MGHIITLILDLLTHWTVPSWFSWHDCTQQREKSGMCKWFALVLSIEMCGCLFSSQFVFPRVWSCSYMQYSELERAFEKPSCASLSSTVCTCPGFGEYECIKYSKAYISIRMCNMTLVSVVQLPLQHVAWWVCGAGLVRREAAVWRSGLLLQRKAYVGLTGRAVQRSHQSGPFIRSDANRNCSH